MTLYVIIGHYCRYMHYMPLFHYMPLYVIVCHYSANVIICHYFFDVIMCHYMSLYAAELNATVRQLEAGW